MTPINNYCYECCNIAKQGIDRMRWCYRVGCMVYSHSVACEHFNNEDVY